MNNKITIVHERIQTIICNYELSYYPFDWQECTLDIFDHRSYKFFFTIKKINFLGNHFHHEYQFMFFRQFNYTENNCIGYIIKIYFRNQYGYFVTSAYIPTMLILYITTLSFFFNVHDFENRITVSLTCFLVMITLSSQLVVGLPKTSYMKMIDGWFFGCLVYIFIVVFTHVKIEKERVSIHCVQPDNLKQTVPIQSITEDNLKLHNRSLIYYHINNKAKKVFPFLLIVYIIIYILFALYCIYVFPYFHLFSTEI